MPVITEEHRGRIVPPPVSGDCGGSGDGNEDYRPFPISKDQMGLWLLLTAIVMLFAGLTSAYMVLRGVPGWQNIALPSLLWPNTAVLILSSVAFELAKSAVRRNQINTMKVWLATSGALGLGFIVGQFAAWRQLVRAGVYLQSTLQSSFFYVLTGLHGLHLLGGVIALTAVLYMTAGNRLTLFNHEPLDLCATYWHVMDGLWIFLFLLLFFS